MTHPCEGHACDHCYLCDVVGVCCAAVPEGVSVDSWSDDRLRDAVVVDAASTASLIELVHIDAARPALPRGSFAPEVVFNNQTAKEVSYVPATRRHP